MGAGQLPADADALFTFGELLLAESHFLLRSPGERAGSPAEMQRVIERFAVLPNHLLLSVFLDAQVVGEPIVMAVNSNAIDCLERWELAFSRPIPDGDSGSG